MTPPDHQCAFRDELERTRAELERFREEVAKLQAEVGQIKRRSKQHKSEKMPPPEDEIRRTKDEKPDPEKVRKKRKARAEARLAIEWRNVTTPVPDGERCCPRCDERPALTAIAPSDDKVSLFVEWYPGAFVGERRRLETLACGVCNYIVTAPALPRVGVARRHGPGFVAHVVTAKCADSIPLYRLAKRFSREGIPMARQTMNDLLHGAAAELKPIADRILRIIRAEPIVRADETSMRVQKRAKRGFFWTFVAECDAPADTGAPWLVAYCFSPDRSGETPAKVLGSSLGTLVIDGFTGYNRVLSVKGRRRAGCLAHARRKFHDALETAPKEARKALDLILDVYRVEHEARERDIIGTEAHLELRETKGRVAMDQLAAWLKEQAPLHPPRGPLGLAIRYARRQWAALTVFLEDARIPVDNNASERALRVIALGRKNYLHVGHDEAGRNLATLYTLVATCEANGVDPQRYLKDVLIRIKTTDQSQLDDLLPHRWAEARRASNVEEPTALAAAVTLAPAPEPTGVVDVGSPAESESAPPAPGGEASPSEPRAREPSVVVPSTVTRAPVPDPAATGPQAHGTTPALEPRRSTPASERNRASAPRPSAPNLARTSSTPTVRSPGVRRRNAESPADVPAAPDHPRTAGSESAAQGTSTTKRPASGPPRPQPP